MTAHKKIRITTKTGDRGQTRLFGGQKVSKTHERLKAYGDLDELVSLLGVVRSQTKDEFLVNSILDLQRQLFQLGSELATPEDSLERLIKKIDASSVQIIDQKIEDLNEIVDVPNDFILPGESVLGAYLDLSRSISRRMERQIVLLFESGAVKNKHILVWVNRLSDYLYLLARRYENKSRPVK